MAKACSTVEPLTVPKGVINDRKALDHWLDEKAEMISEQPIPSGDGMTNLYAIGNRGKISAPADRAFGKIRLVLEALVENKQLAVAPV
ncbi:MAG: hypothetical protein KGI45_02405 [Patescibacteria group bacterium]|nr:hypothetical protein [Patescibacteria group bacterium]MDE1940565.1 hypothetical protein [Patescibacteria group bacterium]MDE1966903.1 hypothetical protein [Patescibacteria group bacterium]